jgi:chromosome segregation ATPase
MYSSLELTFMKDLELLVSGIEYKVRKLTGQMEVLKEELNRVELEKQNLEKVVREKRNEVKTLEEKIKLINVAKSIESGKDSAQAKQKINELMREIDKCIGLLNNK